MLFTLQFSLLQFKDMHQMSGCSSVMPLMPSALTHKENQLLYSQTVISQFNDRFSFLERYSFIQARTSDCIDFVIQSARGANESLTSMLNSNKISLSKVCIVNYGFVSTKFFKSQEDLSVSHDNFILTCSLLWFDVIVQQLLTASKFFLLFSSNLLLRRLRLLFICSVINPLHL